MEHADILQKAYIGGREEKPGEFNRIEYASKALVSRIQNTQNFFLCAANENPHITVEDLWLAALADSFVNSPKSKANNDDLLEQLKIAEKQLGLSAQKVKRILSQRLLVTYVAIVGSAFLTISGLGGAIAIMSIIGFKTVTAMVFISGLIALAGLGTFIAKKAISSYTYEKDKINVIDKQTKAFMQKQMNGRYNQAQIFILNRVQALLPELTLR